MEDNRPLSPVPTSLLKLVHGGLVDLPNKRLTQGAFVDPDGTVCAIGAGLVKSVSLTAHVPFEEALADYGTSSRPLYCKTKLDIEASNWGCVSHVNDTFCRWGIADPEIGSLGPSHERVQRARYAYVKGVVEAELAFRGEL